jgi:hypothetical protein
MRLVALQSLISAELADVSGLPLPPWPRCFQRTYAVLTRHRPPFSLESGFILSCASPLFRVHDRPTLADTLTSISHLPWGPSPHRDTSTRNSPTDKLPTLAYEPPSVFLTLSTDYPSLHLVSLFHPTATSGIHSSGAFPAVQLTHLIGESSPLVVSNLLLQPSELDCPDPEARSSGASSRQRSVAPNRGFRPAHRSIPS